RTCAPGRASHAAGSGRGCRSSARSFLLPPGGPAGPRTTITEHAVHGSPGQRPSCVLDHADPRRRYAAGGPPEPAMFGLDALMLARIQFAFTISFHIIFPAITIGLAAYLAVLEGLWLARKRQVYLDLYRFWLKPFAVAFGMGVVSGILMAYQFGTNWSEFSRFAGSITGPLDRKSTRLNSS